MPEPKYSPQEFAQILKQKYPQYSDVEDSVLVEKILEKYPQYSNSVDVGLKKKRRWSINWYWGGNFFYGFKINYVSYSIIFGVGKSNT